MMNIPYFVINNLFLIEDRIVPTSKHPPTHYGTRN